jgi:hypothetical protein
MHFSAILIYKIKIKFSLKEWVLIGTLKIHSKLKIFILINIIRFDIIDSIKIKINIKKKIIVIIDPKEEIKFQNNIKLENLI